MEKKQNLRFLFLPNLSPVWQPKRRRCRLSVGKTTLFTAVPVIRTDCRVCHQGIPEPSDVLDKETSSSTDPKLHSVYCREWTHRSTCLYRKVDAGRKNDTRSMTPASSVVPSVVSGREFPEYYPILSSILFNHLTVNLFHWSLLPSTFLFNHVPFHFPSLHPPSLVHICPLAPTGESPPP